MRVPGGGRLESAAEERMTIHPEPDLLGRVKLPVKVAPACKVITSPGCAWLSAPWKSPPALTSRTPPFGGE